jgi:hypothetical protein
MRPLKNYILVFQPFAYLHRVFFISVLGAFVLISKLLLAFYASDEIWLLGKNNFDTLQKIFV